MKESTRPNEGIKTGASDNAILSINTNDTQEQRNFILRTLARGSVTTQELRDGGIKHSRVARYSLQNGNNSL